MGVKGGEFLRRRFENRAILILTCRIVTPMFLGDAWQEAALRAAPFKGLLRYWWRVAAGSRVKDHKELLERETEFFGGGGEKAQKSLVRIWVEGEVESTKDVISKKENYVVHPEVDFCPKECLKENPTCRYKKKADCQKRHEISPFSYLGGMGLFYSDGFRVRRSYLAPGESFTLNMGVPEYLLEDNEEAEIFKTALLYFRAFGAVGSRSRNGWGSFQVEGIEPESCILKLKDGLKGSLPYWKDCFDKPHPHTLATDHEGKILLWKAEKFKSWQEALKFLAEVYIYVRTGYVPEEYNWPKKTKLDPDGTHNIAERHLLGFPLTNHPAVNVGWGKWSQKKNKYVPDARLASPLRFLVKKYSNIYKVFVLHLPYYLDPKLYSKSNEKVEWISKKQQIEIWQKVHERLDQAMQRAGINECL
ncbi:type III-B CRISPR module RAMP protein Cmr1 [Thermosulfurimonas sp. F29]|uniref:type III-B CRISPR module RAMP protein Cmr1 n=1 Tax=Thermosulfurimonas sp. F29 TaxID=2867247 RepID=UPI001C835A80|nr:type III-B CRISPR module RAMP protein Cmr1 [Thermosulfurimonas sp. F29]MBX6423233.1 type III-B CRISPR module RAMP protein Cmr1 [Thermosulfurimonas sp. F29]